MSYKKAFVHCVGFSGILLVKILGTTAMYLYVMYNDSLLTYTTQ
jgi:hypothetical protein